MVTYERILWTQNSGRATELSRKLNELSRKLSELSRKLNVAKHNSRLLRVFQAMFRVEIKVQLT